MNAGSIKTCETLQKILSLLEFKGPSGATTLEIHNAVGCLNVATNVSALRQNGYKINCHFERLTEDRRKVYRYTLEGELWAS